MDTEEVLYKLGKYYNARSAKCTLEGCHENSFNYLLKAYVCYVSLEDIDERKKFEKVFQKFRVPKKYLQQFVKEQIKEINKLVEIMSGASEEKQEKMLEFILSK